MKTEKSVRSLLDVCNSQMTRVNSKIFCYPYFIMKIVCFLFSFWCVNTLIFKEWWLMIINDDERSCAVGDGPPTLDTCPCSGEG